MGVEDLLQKHSLVEADINVLGERVKAVVQQSQRFLDQETTEGYRPCDPTVIVDRVQQLEVRYVATSRTHAPRTKLLQLLHFIFSVTFPQCKYFNIHIIS